MNLNYFNYTEAVRGLQIQYNETIIRDCHGLRKLAFHHHLAGAPSVVYDIGANVGLVSIQARMLFPHSRVVAVEPVPLTFDVLCLNIRHLNIESRNVGLGDGQPKGLATCREMDGCNQVMHAEGIMLPTLPLSKIVDESDDSQKLGGVVIVMDCEGAEKYLLADPKAGAILKACKYWAMEYHSELVGMSPREFFNRLGVSPLISSTELENRYNVVSM